MPNTQERSPIVIGDSCKMAALCKNSVSCFFTKKIQSAVHNNRFLGLRRFASLGSTESSDVVTHTGQKFEKDDPRLARFINTPKQVNPQHAIKLIAEVPPIPVKARVTFCDGGDPHLGHPKVYINLDQPGNHSCGYCGLRYFQEKHH